MLESSGAAYARDEARLKSFFSKRFQIGPGRAGGVWLLVLEAPGGETRGDGGRWWVGGGAELVRQCVRGWGILEHGTKGVWRRKRLGGFLKEVENFVMEAK